MFVYLRNEGQIVRVPSVTLKDCHRPSIGTYNEERIEPALWYKVLILDSIYIDCDNRVIYWNCHRKEEFITMHASPLFDLTPGKLSTYYHDKEKIFRDGQLYDFDPNVDEMFETSRNISRDLNPDLIDKEGNRKCYEELLKLLHVFVLPEVCFYPKDRTVVESVLAEIEKVHEKIEEDIEYKGRMKKNTENSLRKLRNKILQTEDFSSQRYVASLQDSFLKVFLQHLDKELRTLNESLLQNEREIKLYRDSEIKKDSSKLEQVRTERDGILESITKATIAREEIKNVVLRSHVKKRFSRTITKPSDLHELYVEVSKRVDVLSGEIKEKIYAKIKVSSVREAVLLTMKEIDTDGRSFGFNRKKGTFETETDLFDPNKLPEDWATLNDKVKTYLIVKPIGYRTKYEKFCERVKNQCQRLIEDTKLFTGMSDLVEPLSPETEDFISIIGDKSVRRPSKMAPNCPPGTVHGVLKRERSFSTRWSMGSISRADCERICKDVTKHIEEMAYDLALEIQGNQCQHLQQNFVNKVYICYEQHVAEELMPILCDLYEQSYRAQCFSLSEWLKRYSASDVGYGEETFRKLLENPLDHSLTRPRSMYVNNLIVGDKHDRTKARATTGYVSMTSVPIDQLYSQSDGQDDSMPMSFIGALALGLEEYLKMDLDCKDHLPNPSASIPPSAFSQENQHDSVFEDEMVSHSAEDSNTDYQLQEVSEYKVIAPHETTVNQTQSEAIANGAGDPVCVVVVDETIYKRDHGTDDSEEVIMRKHDQAVPEVSVLQTLRSRFYQMFDKFYTIIEEENAANTLFSKLRNVTRAIKFIEEQISKHQTKRADLCADDLLDVLLLLLRKLEPEKFLQFYAHLNLLIHLSPQFMQGNAHDYSLVTISVAYQHLFEQQLLHKNSVCV
ncbi:hypothetical protein DPMN_147568 [Dreissena polymorpha]|uniref:VPS9 domain-containing protein n=2 Tax=Dreissena polymorpha TaxID=45954 RepID=A0A9D4FA44_DREPO|nr:hypothetical protein DPMN_147568 [Dreissena polymorpha]